MDIFLFTINFKSNCIVIRDHTLYVNSANELRMCFMIQDMVSRGEDSTQTQEECAFCCCSEAWAVTFIRAFVYGAF
jgi:hypothetical protein